MPAILIVDDEQKMREFVALFLRSSKSPFQPPGLEGRDKAPGILGKSGTRRRSAGHTSCLRQWPAAWSASTVPPTEAVPPASGLCSNAHSTFCNPDCTKVSARKRRRLESHCPVP